jgi:hypothetical protein
VVALLSLGVKRTMNIGTLKTTSMDSSPLKWRWTDPKYCLMPEKDLNRIHPLDEESAKIVWEKSLTFVCEENDFSPSPKLFKEIDSVEAVDKESVTTWLRNKLETSQIIVSWQPDSAVITDMDTFLKYWDDFCYPSSDDVSVWPENEAWVLNYSHEEVFWYGTALSV